MRDDTPAPNGNGHGDATGVTAEEITRQVSRTLQSTLNTQQLSAMLRDLETTRNDRELGPAKMLVELVGTVLAKAGTPPPGNDRLTDLLITELKDLKQELREVRTAASATTSPGAGAGAATPAGKLAEDIRGVIAAAELLGLKPLSPAAPASSLWTPEAVKCAIDAAAPILNRVTDLVQLRLLPGGAPPAASPALPAPGGTTVDQSPPPVNPAIAEQIAFFLEALRTRDFPTVLWSLENLFVGPDGAPLVTIDPDVNPLAYVLKLKPFAPKIDELRGEVADFLKWVRERREGSTA